MDQERLMRIAVLAASVREKTLAIISKTQGLKRLNGKLRLFLSSLDAYSLDAAPSHPRNARKTRDSQQGSSPSKKIKPGDEPPRKHSEDKENDGREDPKDRINRLFRLNKGQKGVALQIYSLLQESDVTSLDDIVRGIKLSKYRVIEILKLMVKEKIVSKFFEKGFMYKVNSEV